MSRLTDYELDQLLKDAQIADRAMKVFAPRFGLNVSEYSPLIPRLTRLLAESRELRDQAAERQHMAALEEET
jgi:hypothetical protein